MKKKILIAAVSLMLAASMSGCAGLNRQYVNINDNSYISDYTQTVTTTYTETEKDGLELYNQIFNLENKVSVSISMTRDEIGKLQEDYQRYTELDENAKSEIYRKADVTFQIGNDSYTVEEVGIRLKGNQSIRHFYDYDGKPNICSFKISFDETFDDEEDYGADVKTWTNADDREKRKKRTFATLEKLDVKWNISYDETYIREIYATKLFEASDCLVQKIGLSQMTFNGNNYGLVKIYEPVDKKFLEKRLPESATGGDLYKCMWSECDNTGKRTGKWRGADYDTSDSYGVEENQKGIKYNFNIKTNKKTTDHFALKNFLDVVNRQDITKEELERVLDVDNYAGFMAAGYFSADPDDIRHNYNNHYIYFRKDNGKALFIVYDNDRPFGITHGLNVNCAVVEPYSNSSATQGRTQQNNLIKNTVTTDALPQLSYVKDKYTAALKKLSETEMLKSDEDFNKMYEKAKANYEDIITPYIRFANQEKDFKFSLDGVQGGSDTENMSFEQFRSQIMETYKKG